MQYCIPFYSVFPSNGTSITCSLVSFVVLRECPELGETFLFSASRTAKVKRIMERHPRGHGSSITISNSNIIYFSLRGGAHNCMLLHCLIGSFMLTRVCLSIHFPTFHFILKRNRNPGIVEEYIPPRDPVSIQPPLEKQVLYFQY